MTETTKNQNEAQTGGTLCAYTKYVEQAKKYTDPLSFEAWKKELESVVETC